MLAYQYQLTIVGTRDLQPKMVWSPLVATWQVLQAVTFTIRCTAEKIQLPIRKTLLLGAPAL